MTERVFTIDPSGFPMIKFPEISGYVSWYPVTKLQFEDFLCKTDQMQFDDNWYKLVREKNPRETSTRLSNQNYWNAFLTGISPEEVDNYILELGLDYAVIAFSNWLKVYNQAKSESPIDLSIVLQNVTNVQMRSLIERMNNLLPRIAREFGTTEPSLADQMFLRNGVGEWVFSPGQQNPWQVAGKPNPTFHQAATSIDQGRPISPFQERLGDVGFAGIRLFRYADE